MEAPLAAYKAQETKLQLETNKAQNILLGAYDVLETEPQKKKVTVEAIQLVV